MVPGGREEFKIETAHNDSGAYIVKLVGPLTLRTLFDFQAAARQEASRPLIIDLAGVPYMDSAGLGSMISAFATCQRTQRGFAIIGLPDRVRTLFEMTRVDGLLPCFSSLEAAERSLK